MTACGGGDGGAISDSGFTVESGVAQKGPLSQGSTIWINELAATSYQPNGKEYTFFTNNNLGTFTPGGTTYSTPYLSTFAQGYYFNEVTGAQSSDTVGLRGLSQIGKVGNAPADTVINVNALSTMAVNRITRLATTAPVQAFALARAQAQKEALGSFYIYNGTSILTGTTVNSVAQPGNLTALDLSKSRAGDQILAALSAVVMTAGVNGAGVNLLLSQIANDLADDGLLNNSTQYSTSAQSLLCTATTTADFTAVANNLNTFFGTHYQASDLSQWVDTSGCVDQVINKYKFSASNVLVGTMSRSPAYVAGPDDVGQCFSVGGVTAGATAGLYYKGEANPVVGTQKVVLGDSLTLALTATASGSFTGYIQRSAPATNGTCPGTAPTSRQVRVQKYSVSTGNVTFNAANGHYYEVVNSAVTWTEALNAAAGMSYLGMPGYLVTITNLQEQAFVTALVTAKVTTGWDGQSAWIAASNANASGVWTWRAGPEAGSAFWSGYGSGTSANAAFNAWYFPFFNSPNLACGGSGCWSNPTGTGAEYAFIDAFGSYGGVNANWALGYSSTTAQSNVNSPIASSDGVRNAFIVEYSPAH